MVLDPSSLRDEALIDIIKNNWSKWRRAKPYYPTEVMWWERSVKPKLRRILKQAERERYHDLKNMENHLYECLFDVLHSTIQPTEKLA
jgi:hypothetical protein